MSNLFSKINFFNILITGIILLFLWLFNKDYLTPLLSGFIAAGLSYPIFDFVRRKLLSKFPKLGKNVAAIFTIFCTFLILIVFLNVILVQLVKELPVFQKGVTNFALNLPQNESFKKLFNLSVEQAQDMSNSLGKEVEGIQYRLQNRLEFSRDFISSDSFLRTLEISQRTIGRIFNWIVALVIFLLAWFYALIRGDKWIENIFDVLPLTPKEKDTIRKDLTLGMRNVVYANLLSGFIHALVCAFVMTVFGVENVIILSLIVFVIGFLPLSPSEVAYAIPIVLIFQTNPLAAIILIPICEAIILWVNYILIPKIIAGEDEGNPLLILTSILSGISIFGIMGFIIAPVIMIFVQTLYRILKRRTSEAEE